MLKGGCSIGVMTHPLFKASDGKRNTDCSIFQIDLIPF
jgi:hypothetical protein